MGTSLGKIPGYRDKISNDIEVLGFVGSKLEGEDFDRLVKRFQKLLPGKLDYNILAESMTTLAGKELTRSLIFETAWRLAGNLPRLRRGQSVQPWLRQVAEERCPMQIMQGKYAYNRDKAPAAEFKLLVLSGTPCGMYIRKFWTKRFCSLLSSRVGFTKPWGQHPFRDVMQLVNMRIYGLVTPELSIGKPSFRITSISSSMVNWNREYLKVRARHPGVFECPFNYPRERFCHMCHVGQDQCMAAVHPKTYAWRHCETCNKDAWFEPGRLQTMCVECAKRELYQLA